MLLDEVAFYLQSEGIGTVGSDLFKYRPPNSPSTLMYINETAGSGPQHTFGTTAPVWENARFQIVSRSTDYQIARNEAEDAFLKLVNIANQTLKPSSSATGCFYLRVTAMQSPFLLGVDDNERILVACNYSAEKQTST